MNTTRCPQPPSTTESFNNKPRVIVLEEDLLAMEQRVKQLELDVKLGIGSQQALVKENETLLAQLDKGFQILFECGYCECGGRIIHHIDEPFFDCNACNRHGESTVIPLIQRFTIQTQKNEQELSQLRAEYKNALEAMDRKDTLLKVYLCRAESQLSTDSRSGNYDEIRMLRNAINQTPLAI